MTNDKTPQNVAVWFELPATDLKRAVGFYERALGITLKEEMMGESHMAVFPYQEPNMTGCVVTRADLKPSADGSTVYLNANGQLTSVMARIEPAGGKLLTPKIDLPGDMGSFFQALDSEGNRIGFHSLP